MSGWVVEVGDIMFRDGRYGRDVIVEYGMGWFVTQSTKVEEVAPPSAPENIWHTSYNPGKERSVSYNTRVRGGFVVEPELSWAEIKGSPFKNANQKAEGERVVWRAPKIDLDLLVSEVSVATEEGDLICRSSSCLEMRQIDEYRERDLVKQVQKIVDIFPGHTFTGELHCEGEENEDIWRIRVIEGTATREDAKMLFPADQARLYVEEWGRFRGKVLNEVWCALRDAEGGSLLEAMNVVNALVAERPPWAREK